ncbi:Hypothetical Protein FCC1311_100992 [Hondaea fermentalgiana]|uniref:Uncharacterized protein n=1 Tax=Hondaea fermentalgiana TaxID=2315210 RepID=A0A2R5GSM4_9STRA|nr:Hypothetical Protein FCC1311_100992 [Hondaea fermentalgiana]|eukprot:GBG33876.1 Hypothetical Protein FCC1311_100992 [Hondaea fermentalgiana]
MAPPRQQQSDAGLSSGAWWLTVAMSAATTVAAGGALLALLASAQAKGGAGGRKNGVGTRAEPARQAEPERDEAAAAKAQEQERAKARDAQEQKVGDQLKAFLLRQLMADPEYSVERDSGRDEDKLKQVVMDTAKDAMWRLIEEDMARKDFRRLFALIDELKQVMASITPNRKDLHAQLDAALDLDLLGQMLEHNSAASWDLRPLTEFVVKYIRMLEAPARSEHTDAWLKSYLAKLDAADKDHHDELHHKVHLLHEFFDFCHEKLEQVRLDMTNAFLRQISPVVSEEGADMIRAEFQKRVDAGEVSLEYTRAFVAKAFPSGEEPRSLPVALRGAILDLILPGGENELERCDPELVFREGGPISVALPETMADERATLEDFVHRAQAIWRLAFAILRIRQMVPDATPEAIDKVSALLGQRLGNKLEVFTDDRAEDGGMQGKTTKVVHRQRESMAKALTDAVLEELKKFCSIDAPEEGVLQNLLYKSIHPPAGFIQQDATYKIINDRLRGIITALVVPPPDKTKSEDQLKMLEAMRLSPLAKPIASLVQEIRIFAARDLRIHTQTYATLAKEVLAETSGQAASIASSETENENEAATSTSPESSSSEAVQH